MESIRRATVARYVGLAGLGLASLLLYSWLFGALASLDSATWTPVAESVGVSLWPELTGQRPTLTAQSKAQQHAAGAVDFAVGTAALYGLYLAAVVLARGRSGVAGAAMVLGLGAGFQGLAALAPYGLSTDVYSYAIYGRMFGVYWGNPYLELPAQYPGDPFSEYVFWKFVPSFYGPLWTLISGEIASHAGHDIGLAVLYFRALAGLSVVAAALVVYLTVRKADPDRALTGATLVAWCPLAVVECGLSAHNDVLMAAFVVLALALASARWPALAVGAALLAALVKVTALALLPLLGLYLLRNAPSWRARAGIVGRSVLVAAPVVYLVVAPVWAGPATFSVGTLGSGEDRYVNSLAEPLLGELRVRLGASREDLEVPLQFTGWWVGTHTPTTLYEAPAGDDTLQAVAAWAPLLVVGPQRGDRLRVIDPATHTIGYVPSAMIGPIDPPAEYANDPEMQARIQGPRGSWALSEANRQIRWVGWGAFILAFIVAAVFGTGSAAGLAAAWVGLCLVLDYVTLTWFWPWYVLWGVLAAGLVPRARVSRLTVWLSFGVLLMYAGLGFRNTSGWFLDTYRSVPVFLLPLAAFLLDELLRALWMLAKLAGRGARRVPTLLTARRRVAASPAP